ncbi:MAG: hypothetical protein AAFR61_28385 [Bacteroidota bacterium]
MHKLLLPFLAFFLFCAISVSGQLVHHTTYRSASEALSLREGQLYFALGNYEEAYRIFSAATLAASALEYEEALRWLDETKICGELYETGHKAFRRAEALRALGFEESEERWKQSYSEAWRAFSSLAEKNPAHPHIGYLKKKAGRYSGHRRKIIWKSIFYGLGMLGLGALLVFKNRE